MSAKGIVTHVALYAKLSKSGFVNTKLRVHSEDSLDAIYRVIETSALGTLSRKHWFFFLESEGVILAAVPAYIPRYSGFSPNGMDGKVFYGKPKYQQRRFYSRLITSLRSPTASSYAQSIASSWFPELQWQKLPDGSLTTDGSFGSIEVEVSSTD